VRRKTAVFTMLATFLAGVFSFESLKTFRQFTNYEEVPKVVLENKNEKISFYFTDGMMSNLPEVKIELLKNRKF
jgi:hypothetical protein